VPDKKQNKRTPYIGDYAVFGELGHGGMGVVYEAQDVRLDRRVALKVLHSGLVATRQSADRFRLEAVAASRLEHPNIVPVYEAGESDGQPYLAMGLVEGESLAERIAREKTKVAPREAATLAVKIARAIHHAHERGVLHRDLKPGNVLLDGQGEPHMIDFGLAKCLGEETGMTLTGTFVGTPSYASPEQAQGKTAFITIASDVYGLGAILFAALTGQPPFRGETASEIIEKVKHEEPPDPRFLRRDVPADLATICLKCLQKEPERRYRTALALAEDLDRFLSGRPISARPSGPTERLWLWARRKPAHAALALLLGLAAIMVPVLIYRNRTAQLRAEVLRSRVQADEQSRGQALLQAEILRIGSRSAGWATQHDALLLRASRVGADTNLFDRVAAALAGLDICPLAAKTAQGSSVTFSWTGEVLFGGLSNSNTPAHLWNPDTRQFEELPVNGVGPVGFDAEDTPLQFIGFAGGRFALRNVRSREVRRWFGLAGYSDTGEDSRPALAMAPDTTKVAAAVRTPEGGRFAVWDALSGEPLGKVDDLVCAIAFSPDGALLATGDSNGTVVVRRLPALEVISSLSVGRFPIACLAFGANSRANFPGETEELPWDLAVGDNVAAISVINLSARRVRKELQDPAFSLSALAFSHDGTILASASARIRLWDVASGRVLLNAPGYGSVSGVAFSSDGRRLASASELLWGGTSLNVWDIEDHRGIRTLRGLNAGIERVWWSPDGKRVGGLAFNWELGVWAMPEGRLTHLLRVPPGESADNAALIFFPDSPRMAFAAGSEVFVYDLAERRQLHRWPLPAGYADSLRLENEGRLLHLHSEGTQGPERRMWVLRNLFAKDPEKPLFKQPDTNSLTWQTDLPPAGNLLLVSGGARDTNVTGSALIAWSTETGAQLWKVPSSLRYDGGQWCRDPTATFLACCLDDKGRCDLFRLPGGERVGPLVPGTAAMSPSGRQLVLPYGRFLFEGADAKQSIALSVDVQGGGTTSVFSTDGQWLAWPTDQGWVLVADLAEVQRRLRVLGWTPR
jgi:WD40 repeat protein